MSAVREATCEVLRSLGMTTVFGNPGSNELPLLDRLPTVTLFDRRSNISHRCLMPSSSKEYFSRNSSR
jgi:hypothetical protein